MADLVLLVARANVTTTDKAQRSMEILTRLEAPLGGVVLMASEAPTNDYYYYYQRGRVPGRKQKRAYTHPVAKGAANGTERRCERILVEWVIGGPRTGE